MRLSRRSNDSVVASCKEAQPFISIDGVLDWGEFIMGFHAIVHASMLELESSNNSILHKKRERKFVGRIFSEREIL